MPLLHQQQQCKDDARAKQCMMLARANAIFGWILCVVVERRRREQL
jgi:hypothetical protein